MDWKDEKKILTEQLEILLAEDLLARGEKRWIETIETFNERGYVWRDVYFVTCGELRSIPDGTPIPASAGPPPQP